MAILTLTTDFGLKDGNVGAMKGVIWSICRQAQIADISHTISPQNIPEAGLVLARAARYFPADTIHVAVVDPGVGTSRRAIAARLGVCFFVGPDNGVCTRLLDWAEASRQPVEFVHLDQPQYWLPEVSHVFHGRDIFAPVAAHLAVGVGLRQLGTPIADVLRLPLPQVERLPDRLRGEIIHIDHFGNLHTSLRQQDIGWQTAATIALCGVKIYGMVSTFGDLPAGELAALYGSNGDLIISVVNGNAAGRLHARIGDMVEVYAADG